MAHATRSGTWQQHVESTVQLQGFKRNYGVQQYVSISAPVLTQYRCAVCVVCGAKKNTWIMVLSGPVRH
jgi:hypothetical protein